MGRVVAESYDLVMRSAGKRLPVREPRIHVVLRRLNVASTGAEGVGGLVWPETV
jgi:hypothetical protein